MTHEFPEFSDRPGYLLGRPFVEYIQEWQRRRWGENIRLCKEQTKKMRNPRCCYCDSPLPITKYITDADREAFIAEYVALSAQWASNPHDRELATEMIRKHAQVRNAVVGFYRRHEPGHEKCPAWVGAWEGMVNWRAEVVKDPQVEIAHRAAGLGGARRLHVESSLIEDGGRQHSLVTLSGGMGVPALNEAVAEAGTPWVTTVPTSTAMKPKAQTVITMLKSGLPLADSGTGLPVRPEARFKLVEHLMQGVRLGSERVLEDAVFFLGDWLKPKAQAAVEWQASGRVIGFDPFTGLGRKVELLGNAFVVRLTLCDETRMARALAQHWGEAA